MNDITTVQPEPSTVRYLLVEGSTFAELSPLYHFIEDHTTYEVSPFSEGMTCFGIHIDDQHVPDEDLKGCLIGLGLDIKKLFNFKTTVTTGVV